MYLAKIEGYWYLFQKQKDKNGKWFNVTLEKFGKGKPVRYIPKLLQGDVIERLHDIPDESIDLAFADPPYGITQNRWDEKPQWKKTNYCGNFH